MKQTDSRKHQAQKGALAPKKSQRARNGSEIACNRPE